MSAPPLSKNAMKKKLKAEKAAAAKAKKKAAIAARGGAQKAGKKKAFMPKHLRKAKPGPKRSKNAYCAFVKQQFKSNSQLKKMKSNVQRLKLLSRLYKAKVAKK